MLGGQTVVTVYDLECRGSDKQKLKVTLATTKLYNLDDGTENK